MSKPTMSRQLWAKSDPHHFLWRHLLDVAAVAEALWPRFGQSGPLEEMPVRWACYVCALHDIGKADPWFQNKSDEPNGLAQSLRDQGLDLPPRREESPELKRFFRHEARSAEWLREHLQESHAWDYEAANVVAQSINGHHGNFAAHAYDDSEEAQHAHWQKLRSDLAQMAWDVLQPPLFSPREFAHAGAMGMALSGLLVLSDWIASNHELFDYRKLQGHDEPHKYLQAAREEAARVVAEMKLDAPALTHEAQPSFAQVWPELKELRPSQRALEAEVRGGRAPLGLAIIEAPMGEGKTEGAVYLCEHWSGLRASSGAYLALPTQATSNQMHDRYSKYLHNRDGSQARLIHGMAWLLDDWAPQSTSQTFGDDSAGSERLLSREWFRPARRALLGGEGVGTVDQALLGALNVKFGFLRLLGLSAKVLVIDEAHAYDAYMTAILERLLAWCRALRIPVVLLSATLSQSQKRKLVAAYGGSIDNLQADSAQAEAYPLLTFVSLDGQARAVPVERDDKQNRDLGLQQQGGLLDDAPAIARLALECVRDGGSACVLMNTVKGAQEVFREVRRLSQGSWEPPCELILFHARFRAQSRNEIEKRVTALFGKDASVKDGSRPARAIVIATQVVEQSLDVDFDFMLSQIAPIDLLLQRSGRLWRHKRERPTASPTLQVLVPRQGELQFGVSEKIYAREVLLRTLATLHGRDVIHLPDEFRPLIEAVYGDACAPSPIVPAEEIEAAARLWQKERGHAVNRANASLLPPPSPRVFSMAATPKQESVDDGEGANRLRATTRLGDDSRAALVLCDAQLIAVTKDSADANKRPPRREVMRNLFEQKVNLPAWWLRETEAAEGYEPLFEGQNWLRHHVIVPLRHGEWRSLNGAVIRDDPALGLLFERAGAQRSTEQIKEEEADAGQTG